MSNSASRHVEATFDKLAEAFAFLDKNGDGKLDKKDIILALNEAPSKEKSPTHITSRRFSKFTIVFFFCQFYSNCNLTILFCKLMQKKWTGTRMEQ